MIEQLEAARHQLEQLEAHLTLARDGAAVVNESPRQLAERLLRLTGRVRANVLAAMAGHECTRHVAAAAGAQVHMLLERFAAPPRRADGPAVAAPAPGDVVGLVSETRIYGVRHPSKAEDAAGCGAKAEDRRA